MEIRKRTWPVADSSVKGRTHDRDIIQFRGVCKTLDMLQMGEASYSSKRPLQSGKESAHHRIPQPSHSLDEKMPRQPVGDISSAVPTAAHSHHIGGERDDRSPGSDGI